MSKESVSYNELDSIANGFLVDVVYTAMNELNIGYDKLYDIFKQIDFFDIINDTDTMVVGAHCGIEDIMQRIRKIAQ